MLKKNVKGFTLAELLIVVAIISVLVAVAIPLFIGQLNKARESTCAANRRSFKAELSAEYMSGDGSGKYNVESPKTATDDQCKCPSGGGITYWQKSNGTFEVACSVHDGMTSNTIPSIIDVLEKIDYLNNTIDSKAPVGKNNYKDNFMNELKKAGIDLDAMGVKTWGYAPNRYQNYNYMLMFSTEDIDSKNTADLVMRVRFDAKGNTLYSIWTDSKVEQTSINGGESYNKLSATGKEIEYTTGTDKTNFEQMKAEYNRIADEKGLKRLI